MTNLSEASPDNRLDFNPHLLPLGLVVAGSSIIVYALMACLIF